MLDTNKLHHCVQQDERIPKLVEKISQLNFSVFFLTFFTSEFFPVGQAIFKIWGLKSDPKTVGGTVLGSLPPADADFQDVQNRQVLAKNNFKIKKNTKLPGTGYAINRIQLCLLYGVPD